MISISTKYVEQNVIKENKYNNKEIDDIANKFYSNSNLQTFFEHNFNVTLQYSENEAKFEKSTKNKTKSRVSKTNDIQK